MKDINQYIKESIMDDDDESFDNKKTCCPETRKELINIIVQSLKDGETDLNFIDTSKITNMSTVFMNVNVKIPVNKIDISKWDVSNVTNMNSMFYDCNKMEISDLSEWDVSNVEQMWQMFYNCKKLDLDLSKWKVQKGTDLDSMFYGTKMSNKKRLPKWFINRYKY